MNYFSNHNKPYVIAEIGVNHDGSINKAIKLIKKAKESGASAVKFQSFKAGRLANKKTPKVKYQIKNIGNNISHYEMLKKLELNFNDHKILKRLCDQLKIDFLSTPYDVESAQLLQKLNVPFYKTASADIVDVFLHKYIASTKIPVAISVGMASLNEIKKTLDIYKSNKSDILLLHCVSNYPCSDESLNLKVINTLKNKFKLPIGYSDHSIGIEAAICAASLGCQFFEKHFTLNKNDKGPDHKASSTPNEFKRLVNSLNRTHKMLGTKEKNLQEEEREMHKISRKSVWYNRVIKKGTKLKENYLTLKRPGDGICPQKIDKIIGKKINKDVKKGEKVLFSHLYK